jgi:hypothetical protein
MEFQDVNAGSQPPPKIGSDPGNLPRAGDENEGVGGAFAAEGVGELRRGRPRHVVQEGGRHSPAVEPRARRRPPVGLQGVEGRGTVHHGSRGPAVVRAADVSGKQCGKPGCVQGGGHGDDGEVTPQLPDVGQHAHQQICLQPAFVDLVQDHRRDALESGVGQQAAQQDAGGDKFNNGSRARLPLAPDGIADAAAQRAAVSTERRLAAARAAIRRGCVTTTRPWPWTGRFASSGGTSVVLPVPGGACTTAARPAPPPSAWVRAANESRKPGRHQRQLGRTVCRRTAAAACPEKSSVHCPRNCS